MADACIGGEGGGQSLCAPGHGGPLCGICADRYHRTRTKCITCTKSAGGNAAAFVAALLLVIGACVYLHAASGKTQWRLVERFGTVTRQVATIAKVLLGYVQVLGAFRRFDYVHWPPLFSHFLAAFDLHIDLELVPLDCVAGASDAAAPGHCALVIALLPLHSSHCNMPLP